MKDQEPYILGTDEEELKGLQTQHNVCRSETIKGWSLAEFKLGDVILDLGSGPGYCTKELAGIVGPSGKVLGLDRSLWEWPKTFYKSYFSRLIGMGLLTNEDEKLAFEDLKNLETVEYATLWCPLRIEVIATK